jgi:hypothetical protein
MHKKLQYSYIDGIRDDKILLRMRYEIINAYIFGDIIIIIVEKFAK